MKFGSLFSGIGGFDLGFEQAGMQCAWQCEIDKHARSVLATHWPGVPCIEDVRDVRRDTVAAVDLICGGFPCQDLSIAGPRTGLAGKRSGLWFEFLRILTELKPRWVVIENVPGLLSSHRGRDFAIVLRGLVKCGYGVAWRVLDAQYFGVAQRRRRVFIVGSLGDGERCAQVLFEREGVPGHPAPRRAAQQEAAAALRADTPSHRDGGSSPPSDALIVSHLTFDWQTAGSARTSIVDAPGATRSLSASKTLAVANTLTAHHGRLDLDSTNYVSSGPGGGVRRLTPTECERLQGFPDGWTAYFTEHGQCVIMGAWLNHFVRLPDVIDRSLTEKTASVLCTTSGSKNTEVRIYRAEMPPPLPDAKSVTGWLGPMDVVDYAPDTINHGSATAILCNQKGISLKEPPIPHGEDGITVLRLNLLLDGPYSEERLSTISTWTQGITPLLISTYAKTQPSMAEYTLHWNAQPQNLSGGDLWCLRVANIGHCSDSARYRQLGNAVAVPVARWIGKKLMEVLP